MEPSFNCLDGVVHGQVDHGVVEYVRRAWPRSGGDGLGSDHVPIDHDIRASGPCPNQTETTMMESLFISASVGRVRMEFGPGPPERGAARERLRLALCCARYG